MTSKFMTTAIAVTATLFLAAAPPAMARDHHHRHHRDYHHRGGNVGAGIAGFAAGAILGGALSSQPYYAYQPRRSYRRGVRWCMRHYRSYDLRTHTYLGYDGYRHRCP